MWIDAATTHLHWPLDENTFITRSVEIADPLKLVCQREPGYEGRSPAPA